jgi:hypothetical protein
MVVGDRPTRLPRASLLEDVLFSGASIEGDRAMSRKFKSRKTPPPVSDLSALPILLTIHEMSAIYRVNSDTIRRQMALHKFRPLPFEKYPYRWRREDVIRDLTEPRPKLKVRKHGFAMAKARREADAELAHAGE